MDRLFIDETEVELDPGTVIAITKQVNDLAELKDRQASYTNEIRVPRTRKNKTTLEDLDLPYSSSIIPFRKKKVKVIKAGIEVISSGYLTAKKADEYFYISVYSGLKDFFSIIEGKYLSDLDLSAYNHAFDFSTILGATGASGDGVVYPLVCYTDDATYMSDTTNDVDVRRLAPAIFYKTIVEKIFKEAGFTLTGEFWQSSFFKNLLLQLGTEGLINTGKILHAQSSVISGGPVFTGGTHMILDQSTGGDPVLKTGNFDIGGSWQNASGGVDAANASRFYFQQNYQVPSQLRLKYKIKYKITGGTPYTDTWRIYMTSYESLVPKHRWLIKSETIYPGQTINGIVETELPAGNYTSGYGNYIEIRCECFSFNAPNWSYFYFMPGSEVEAEAFTGAYVNFLDPVIIKYNLPKITQTEFIKAIANAGAITFQRDRFKNEIRGESFDVIIRNKGNAKDWSDKLHIERDKNGNILIPVDYGSAYARSNAFKYADDTDVTSGYGDGNLTVDDETLDPIKSIYEMPFSATEYVTKFGTKKVPRIHLYDESTVPVYPKNKFKPRVLLLDLDNSGVDTFNFTDGGSTVAVNTNIPHAHFLHPDKTENLAWSNSLLENYYKNLKKILDRFGKFTPLFKLDGVDIEELDHFTPIYLKFFSSYFYVNKIINWTGPETLTRVELIKLEGRVTGSNGEPKLWGPELLTHINGFGFLFWSNAGGFWGFSGVTGQPYKIPGNTDDVSTDSWFNGTWYPLTSGNTYKAIVEIAGITAGSMDLIVGIDNVGTITTNGTHEFEFMFTGGSSTNFTCRGDASFDGNIITQSLKELL